MAATLPPRLQHVDVGHTNPFFTFPVGGTGRVSAGADDPHVVLVRH